jgi:hypothetical protein
MKTRGGFPPNQPSVIDLTLNQMVAVFHANDCIGMKIAFQYKKLCNTLVFSKYGKGPVGIPNQEPQSRFQRDHRPLGVLLYTHSIHLSLCQGRSNGGSP